MSKSCLSCRYLQELPMGDRLSLFCTRAPPKVEVLHGLNDKNQPTTSLFSWYPPMPMRPCGEYKRAWWRRALRMPVAQAAAPR